MDEEWLQRLKAAYEAGYYRTEVDLATQSPFPWQSAVCGDCPFHMAGRCQVHLGSCSPEATPCAYYDPPHHLAARRLIQRRLELAWRNRWKWEQR